MTQRAGGNSQKNCDEAKQLMQKSPNKGRDHNVQMNSGRRSACSGVAWDHGEACHRSGGERKPRALS